MSSNATSTSASSHADEAFFLPFTSDLARLLVQIIIIISLSSLVARILAYIKQPRVVSEIITGILLGPTAAGYIPGFSDAIFPKASLPIFNEVADLGLIFFMFIIGLEVDISLLKKNYRKAIFISLTGVITPFGIGCLLALILIDRGYKAASANEFHFYLFLGVAVCITAFPVLARIISERKLLNTNIGLLILGSAAVDDGVAWIVLALVIALVRAGSPINALWVLLTMIGFIILIGTIARRMMKKLCEFGINNQRVFILILLLMLASSWFTEAVGVHAIFGAFMFGLIIPRTNHVSHELTRKIEDLTVSLLLPLYFVKSGLKTQLGLLKTGSDWGLCILIIAGACVGKIIPGILAARAVGLQWRECCVVGFLRNAKGLVELIVLNIGLDLGVISLQVFGMLVLMAVITTMLATPLMYVVYPPRRIRADDVLPPGEAAPLLLALIDNQHDFEMFAVASVVKAKKKPIYVLRLRELNELPSSFMPQLDSPAEDVDEHGLSKTTQLQAGLLELDVRMASVSTPWYSNPGQEVLDIAIRRNTRMVLVHQEPSSAGAFDLSVFSKHVVEKVLAESATHVGIVVNHGLLPTVVNPIKTVFFPYGGHPNDAEVLRLIATMARQKSVSVTVMYPPTLAPVKLDALLLLQAARGLTLVACAADESLETAALRHCTENKFDLAVVGTSSDRTDEEHTPSSLSVRVAEFAPQCAATLVLIVFQVPEEQFQARMSMDAATLATLKDPKGVTVIATNPVSSTTGVNGTNGTNGHAHSNYANVDDLEAQSKLKESDV